MMQRLFKNSKLQKCFWLTFSVLIAGLSGIVLLHLYQEYHFKAMRKNWLQQVFRDYKRALEGAERMSKYIQISTKHIGLNMSMHTYRLIAVLLST